MQAIKSPLEFYVDGDQLVALTIYHNYSDCMNGQGFSHWQTQLSESTGGQVLCFTVERNT